MTAHQIHIAACIGTDRLGVWCSCDPKKLLLHGKPGGVYGLAGLNEIAHEHIETEEAAVINRDAINDGRLGRDVGTCPATKDSIAPARGLTCVFPADHADNVRGVVGLRPGTRVHQAKSGVLWFEPRAESEVSDDLSYAALHGYGPEGYGTKSAITSEDELVDIETGLRRSTGEFYRLP